MANAKSFMDWYAANLPTLRRYIAGGPYRLDEDSLTDAFLKVHDAITLRGVKIDDFTGFFLTAYRSVYLDARKSVESKKTAVFSEMERVGGSVFPDLAEDDRFERGECFGEEVLRFVRSNYSPVEVSLFEIYQGLYPAMSYLRLSQMLGFPLSRVIHSLGKIRKGIANNFKIRADYLRTSRAESLTITK